MRENRCWKKQVKRLRMQEDIGEDVEVYRDSLRKI